MDEIAFPANMMRKFVETLSAELGRDTPPINQAQTNDEPIFLVTLGLIQECLFWAVGQVHDVEERACRALGNSQCEFKITIGG